MCRIVAFFAISAVLVQVAFSQTIVPISSLFPNQLLLNSLPNLVSLAPNVVSCEETVVSPIVPVVKGPIVQAPVVPTTTTIIQDNSVANSLANALQLLIVSNLLSNTLPYMGDVVVPNYAPTLDCIAPITPISLGGLNYVF